ncbi:hypothetical protein VTN31DRAFT_6588 [Thermomyces dupontii]|uniref:uncharacterized protein n=1 Tax=Talaromyces thermophilus TaxID=28565 RepID=UPI00374392DA
MKGYYATLGLCLAAAIHAQSVIPSVSFGYGNQYSYLRDGLPGWTVKGEGHEPQLLSDKIILTPPYPGQTRGSIWADNALTVSEWTAEFQFRANGPERHSGNLQLWYVQDGARSVGSSSIYTVGKFDGFVLTIDTHGGTSGSVRGFLNDGTTAYNQHPNVDSLTFGHCEYPYRNLGRPSVITIRQSRAGFEVLVDNRQCFQTNKVALPAGYAFGITAATPENPDSFEIFKFVVGSAGPSQQPPQFQQQQQPQQQRPLGGGYQETQLADLHNRLQALTRIVTNLASKTNEQATQGENRHQSLLAAISQARPADSDALRMINDRLVRIENTLAALQRDAESKDYRSQFAQLHRAIESSHVSLTEALQTSIFNMINAATPRMGLFITLLVLFQLILAAAYIIYKRRKNNIPKKFL